MSNQRIANLEAEILRSPDADEPRLQLADLLEQQGDPRGEFIKVQFAIRDWRRGQSINLRDINRREAELLSAHGAQWSAGIEQLVERIEFRRGFVEKVTCGPDVFHRSHRDFEKKAPIRHLVLKSVQGAHPLFGDAALARLVSLSLSRSRIGDDGARAIARSPHVSHLRWLGLANCGIGQDGLEAIATSGSLSNLQYLAFWGNRAPDPTPRPGGIDAIDGKVMDVEMPPEGEALIQRVGRKPWLTIDPSRFRSWPPDPDAV